MFALELIPLLTLILFVIVSILTLFFRQIAEASSWFIIITFFFIIIFQGNRTTPSYVAFTDTERLIGDAAKNQVAMNPSNTGKFYFL